MGQSNKGLSKAVDAMPLPSSEKAITSSAIAASNLKDPETVNRLAGQVFNRPVGQFNVNAARNKYTQQGAYAPEIPFVE